MFNNPVFEFHKLKYFGYQVGALFMEWVTAAIDGDGILFYFYNRLSLVFFAGSIFQCSFKGIK